MHLDTSIVIFIVAALALAAMNLHISLRLGRDPLLERNQKIAQTILVWLLPVFGYFTARYFMNESLTPPPMRSEEEPAIEYDFNLPTPMLDPTNNPD